MCGGSARTWWTASSGAPRQPLPGGRGGHILVCAADDNMAARRAAFLEASDRLREKTRGRKQTPAEVLIREDRDLRPPPHEGSGE